MKFIIYLGVAFFMVHSLHSSDQRTFSVNEKQEQMADLRQWIIDLSQLQEQQAVIVAQLRQQVVDLERKNYCLEATVVALSSALAEVGDRLCRLEEERSSFGIVSPAVTARVPSAGCHTVTPHSDRLGSSQDEEG